MLVITVPGEELYDETTSEFFTVGDVELQLEHSLVSLSKWESKYQRAFLGPGEKSREETLDYIRMMILTDDYPEVVVSRLSAENLQKIDAYVNSSQSATVITDIPEPKGRVERITAELIYYWMITYTIPFECQFWHLNRLFALIRICGIKSGNSKKMSKAEQARAFAELNARRKAELGTSG